MPCEITRLLGEAPWTLRFVPLPGDGVVTHERVVTLLPHPFARVLHCLKARVMFSMPRQPERSAADAVQSEIMRAAVLRDRRVSVASPPSSAPRAPAQLRLRAESVCMALPPVVAPLTGERWLELCVDSETHAALHFAWTRNVTLRSVGAFQEWAVYRPDPRDPEGATEYVSVVQMAGTTWLGRQVLSLVGGTGGGIIGQHITLMRARLDELRAAEEQGGEGRESD